LDPGEAEVVLVIGNNSGSGIFSVAAELDVPTLHLSGRTHPADDARDAAMLQALTGAGVELVVLAGYMKKIGPRVRAAFDGAIINTHPSLLPYYGSVGMYGDRVHEAVLRDKVRVTGATIHAVTAEYDEGPVLAQISVPVFPDDDVESLRARVQDAEKSLLSSWLCAWSTCGDQPLSSIMPVQHGVTPPAVSASPTPRQSPPRPAATGDRYR
jgi:phosphoribosylglycinamide formyltransferase-1